MASSQKKQGIPTVTAKSLNQLNAYNKTMKQLQTSMIRLDQFNGLAQMSEEMWKAGDVNARVVRQLVGLKLMAGDAITSISNGVSGTMTVISNGVSSRFQAIGKGVGGAIQSGANTVGKGLGSLWGKVKAIKAAADQKEADKAAAAQQAHYLYGTPLPKPRRLKRMQNIVGSSPIQDSEKQMKLLSSFKSTASSAFSMVQDKSLEAAKAFSTAMGTLRASSGAAPRQLNELANSLRSVGSQVPQNLNEVAKVLGTLSSGTKLTGKSLEGLSKTALDAARLSGSGSAEIAESTFKVMAAWGKPAEEGTFLLDQFYAASRASSVGMGGLMKAMEQVGEPMRLMGFGFEQSTALLAQWQAKGLTPVQDALKKELPTGGLATIADQIRTAATAADAAAIATKYFGQIAGKDLAASLRIGQVEYKGVIAAMNGAKGVIQQQSSDIQTFGDKWDMLQNRITIALAPLGEALLPLGLAMASVIEVLTRDSDIVLATLGSVAALLLGVFAPALWASAVAGWAAVAPFLPIILAVLLVGAAVAGLAYLFKYHMDYIMNKAAEVSDFLSSVFGFSDSGKKTIEVKGGAAGQAVSQGGPLPGNYHGLDYVPYDGMVSRLHKGERIMTASENRAFTQGAGGSGSITISGNTFNVRQDSDIDAIARALAREIKAAGGLMA
ncbi:phage tail tape measure protein [Gorillibacterium timonense]|uniref:phage tail tape measure protein n=1 Tax=Gorillibacterium timonense TaxID=1689269 RepID=UPI00071C2D0E|nr:phage tail tape measure protein [Gorillibacterium timonense]